jgi:hypothetical protein
LDAAVFEAYGWPATLTDDQVLERLVALNAERAMEERDDRVRWLRPDFQQASGADFEPAAIESTDDDRPGIVKSRPPKGPGIAAAQGAAGKRKSKRAAH